VPRVANWWIAKPWSAAFISWVMREAGVQGFTRAGGHSYYIVAAKRNRLKNAANPVKAYRISEAAPRVGDLVCKSRAGSGATYDTIAEGMKTHCDIVTAIRPGSLVTIGGNVGGRRKGDQTVGVTNVPVDSTGKVTKPGYFAVIKTGA
jgi:hypothetical protein